MSDSIISLKNVSKKFWVNDCETIFDYLKLKNLRSKKEISAINEMSFNINKGEFVGLLGVNGAGKSTLIKMMTGILLPTSGEIIVLGNNPFKERMYNNYYIGAVFGQRCQLRWDIAPIESYYLFKSMYRIPEDKFRERVDYLVNILDCKSFINQPLRTLSLGQKMRAELVGAFLHEPKIVFLDEPTLGLDIISKEAIISFLNKCKEEKETTFIFTTHDMEDVKRLCERLIIINNGKVLIDDVMSNLEKYIKLYTIVKLKKNKGEFAIPTELKEMSYEIDGQEICFKVLDETKIAFIINEMFEANTIYGVDIIKPEFKDIFKSLFNEDCSDESIYNFI